MTRMVLTLLLSLFVSACSTTNTNNDSSADSSSAELVQRHLDLAVGYLRNRDYQRAKEKLAKALDIDPKNADVHATYGTVFQLEGELELAEEYFKQAVRYDSNSAQIRNSYGAFLFSEKRFQEAVEQLSKASEDRFYSNRPTVFENLGVAYNRIGDLEGAEFAFIRATQLNPQQPRALIEMSEIRFDQRNYVESRDFYRRYSKVAPATAKSLWLCVRISRIFHEYNEEASCSEALEGIFPASDEYQQYKESA
ncbi:MAG: type IV pilus biogenesis/stability protein PilW [Proteobacteria bacterium]|nr:type IV pilus biogenesis/stability protein PilW [Pseudomonadota bacterium]